MVDLVVSDDGVAAGPYLNAGQCIPVDVIVLNQAPALSKYVDAALMSIVDLVLPAQTT